MTPYLQQRTLFPPQIRTKPSLNLGIVVVIPAHDEEFLLLSLMTLKKCDRTRCDVEVIVVINSSEKEEEAIKEKNWAIAQQAEDWAKKNKRAGIKFSIMHHPDLNPKHAGVGLARKIGMDEASWRFEKIGNPNGVIVCFDADSRCKSNYLTSIEKHFLANPKCPATTIYFEHPLCGADFEEPIYDAIILYELHLRYYIQAQRFSGFPRAFHTVGSSMAVRCKDYQKQGGMNKRKAGEDFYFLHKFTQSPYFTELNSTCVIPSPRPSHRVPFGTGKAVAGLVKNKLKYDTYALESFMELKQLFDQIPSLYESFEKGLSPISEPLKAFLDAVKFESKYQEIKQNTSNLESFKKRFYQWFDAFLLMKYVHFARDQFYPNQEISKMAKALLNAMNITIEENLSAKDLLLKYRALDKGLG